MLKTKLNRFIQKELTQQNILEVLKLGPHTRRELIDALNLRRTTIFDNLYKLMKKNLVEYEDKHNGKRGRPLRYFKLKDGGSNDG